MGTAARTLRSAVSMPATTAAALWSRLTEIFAATSSVSGPRCRVRRCMTRSISGPSSRAVTITRSTSAVADSPISRLLVSIARITAKQPSRTPMPSDPTPSQRSSRVTQVSTTPKRANVSPISAAESSSRTAGTSGALARRMKRTIRRPGLPTTPARLVRFPDRGAERESLEHGRDGQHHERDHGRADLLGVKNPLDALIDGEDGADGEQHHRNDEPVEVALRPEAELMFLGLRTLRPAPAEQEQA